MQVLQASYPCYTAHRLKLSTQISCSRRRSALVKAAANMETHNQVPVKQLKAIHITADNFKPFGQLIKPINDMKAYDEEDAQLQGFDSGIPRFYIMRLPERQLKFDRITYHGKVTQCLGLIAPVSDWYLAVAAPTHSVETYPKEQDLTVFKIPHGVFIKLHKATWHAGPLFTGMPYMDFYNLELSDTNVVDHNSHDFRKTQGFEVQVVDA